MRRDIDGRSEPRFGASRRRVASITRTSRSYRLGKLTTLFLSDLEFVEGRSMPLIDAGALKT